MPLAYEEKGSTKAEMSRMYQDKSENWKVYIAQCPTEEPRPVERIEKECKTESFGVPQEVYPTFKFGQHADFKQPKYSKVTGELREIMRLSQIA